MTRTEQRLAEALDAAARTLREETLRPLVVPERTRRPRQAWTAPRGRIGPPRAAFSNPSGLGGETFGVIAP